MAQVLTLARPYARAAFSVARADQQMASWSAYLAFAAQVALDPHIIALHGDPRVTPGQMQALHLPPDAASGGAFARFLEVLAVGGRLNLLPFIRDEFDALLRDAEATLEVSVTSAQALDEAAQACLSESLARRYGRHIRLNLRQDQALIAGVILEVGGEVIDGSMRGRLQRLAGALAHGN